MASERRLIAHIRAVFANDDPLVEIGIGDDGAVLRTTARTVVVCDPVVEGVHFTREDSLVQVGRKAVNRNLSDLAAMGARPRFVLSSILLPDWLDEALRDELLSGIEAATRASDCTVVGGDVARTSGPLVVTVTALGEAPSRPLRRDGLRAGDTLHLTGPLGGSRAGRHLCFEPRVVEGRWLAEQDEVSAAIDISDGLLIDLASMLDASGGLGAVLDVAAIPVTAAAAQVARESGQTALRHALADGEDHELLFGVRGALGSASPLADEARRAIGVVTEAPGIVLREADGSCRESEPLGYQHDV